MEPRNRKRLLLAFAGIIALVAGTYIVLLLKRDVEPTYQGRKLSEWIAVYGYNGPRNKAPTIAARDEAAHAIHAIGTNALSCLLEWITYEPGALRYKLLTHEEKFPNWLKDRDVVYQWFFGGSDRAYSSQVAFEALGDQAIPAIPELHRLACTAGQSETRIRAVHCLVNIGPDAAPALHSLTNAVNNPDPKIRTAASNALKVITRVTAP